MRVVDLIWTIGPIFRTDGTTMHWLDFAAVLALGGIWLTFFFYNSERRARSRRRTTRTSRKRLAHVGH